MTHAQKLEVTLIGWRWWWWWWWLQIIIQEEGGNPTCSSDVDPAWTKVWLIQIIIIIIVIIISGLFSLHNFSVLLAPLSSPGDDHCFDLFSWTRLTLWYLWWTADFFLDCWSMNISHLYLSHFPGSPLRCYCQVHFNCNHFNDEWQWPGWWW